MNSETSAYRVRPLAAADLTSVLRLALLVREAPSWTYEDFRKLLVTHPAADPSGVHVPGALLVRRAWIAEAQGESASGSDRSVLGLVVVQCLHVSGVRSQGSIEVEAELESILVHPEARRRGIGACLLHAAIGWCVQQRAGVLRLEVRTSNQAALALYERHGFRLTGHRPRYYRNPEEDAALMQLDLLQPLS